MIVTPQFSAGAIFLIDSQCADFLILNDVIEAVYENSLYYSIFAFLLFEYTDKNNYVIFISKGVVIPNCLKV